MGNTKLTLCATAVLGALSVMPAIAQEQQPADAQQRGRGLERIEVTARKTVESIQEVPVAVTSIGAMELAEKGISVLTEVQQFSPNTTLQTSRGTNSTLTAFIRGVGQQDPLWGYEPGVGIYIDDVYMARPQGAVLDLLDVQRIEVLRGPQGTLYGKNTVGGAVKYVTKQMSGGTEFNAEATVGSYSQRDVKLTGQIPLIEDKLFLGFGYGDLNRDGYGSFLVAPAGQDRENYNKDLKAARVTLEFHPADDWFMRLNWDKTTDDSNSKGGYRLAPSLLTEAPIPDNKYDSYTSLPTWNKVELEGISLMVNWDVNDALSLKYIGASRESDSPTNIDFDNTGINLFDVPAVYDDENTSHELQANYRGDGYSLVGGLYAYDSESCGLFDAILGGLGVTLETSGCNNSEAYAAYAQSSIDITEKLSLTLGARYTREEKEASVFYGFLPGAVYPYSDWIDGYARAPGLGVPMSLGVDSNGDGLLDAPKTASWNRFTPRVGIEYQMDRDTMFYASYAQGFKSGTFNPRASKNERAADPEIADSVELGMKKDWNEQWRTNVTLFWLNHKDRQYIVVEADPNDPTVLGQNLGNAAKSKVKGLEAEMTYVATDDLSFDLALGYLDAELEQDKNISTPLIGLSNTPDYTIALSAKYALDTDYGPVVFNGGYYYRDEYILFEDNPVLKQDGYGMVNLSVSWESIDGNWYAGLHGKNLTDEEYMVGGYSFIGGINPDGSYLPGFGGDTTLAAYYGDPRTISLTVGYRF
ncbi:TonB-dependent receptor [Aliiglaciecola sp. CAU 1673]|uniref:TonB-dependent receptor n=1 Tax=Aliiglaciecola sp. CAU 1673 TaxID=3032595 RepID=UPI0023DCA194|nr:TonB-dependent receptor [Aliiglaciecola sp. CAU 1673]MDF2179959.1 TonB-dependent receptor [Aliiglaciecola sp. CAU 1673]